MGFEPTALGSTARRTKNLNAWCGVAYRILEGTLGLSVVRNVRNFLVERQNIEALSGTTGWHPRSRSGLWLCIDIVYTIA